MSDAIRQSDAAEITRDDGDALLGIDELTKKFGGLTAVNNLSFDVKSGEILGFIGPNGAGKSTVFNCVTGVHSPTSGHVFFKGKDVTGRKPHEMVSRGLTRTFQSFKPFSRKSVLDNVRISLMPNKVFTRTGIETVERDRAMEICEFVGLQDRLGQTPDELPHAGLLRLELARAIANDPDLVLIDEPFAGLSNEEVEQMSTLFRQLNSRGVTLVIVDHNMRGLLSLIERAIVISFGELIAEGTPEEIKNDIEVQEAYLGGDEL